MKSVLIPAILIAIPALAPSSSAGDISEVLREEMALRPADQPIGVIVMLEDRVDLVGINDRLDAMGATRAFRHQFVVESLREKANQTQGPVLREVRELSDAGMASDLRTHWITNAITLKANAAAIVSLAQAPGVERVYYGEYPLETIAPVGPPQPAPNAGPGIQGQSIEPGLIDIKADFLWNLGYTGQGRLVSNLDTGVDSNHSALQRWRGHDPGVTPEEAWFDPVTNTNVPFDNNGHGTHTMGTICGADAENIVGVAPSAKWIAAGVIDRVNLGTTITDALLAFEWTIDPDGDPSTITDVPDVSSNSWGISPIFHGVPPCDATFWEVIDGCEAAGCVVVFAAGNEGPSRMTLRTPADRPTTSLNAFSVGALLPGSQDIADFSSRGPSGCNLAAKKPEIAARGQNVRSCWPGQRYISASGTSMACPHVGGSVALLRQVQPNLSSDEVKQLLIDTADDLGVGGDDNTFGHGRVNLEAAYNELMLRTPDVSVALMTSDDRVNQGGSLPYFIAFSNHTNISQLADIRIVIRDPSSSFEATILDFPAAGFPPGFDNSNLPFHLSLSLPNPTPPTFVGIPLEMHIELTQPGSGTQISTAKFAFVIQ